MLLPRCKDWIVYRGKIYAAQNGFPALFSANLDGSDVTEISGFNRSNARDIDIVNGLIFVLDDGGSFSIDDRIYIFDLADLSTNGALVQGLSSSNSLAVVGASSGNHDADTDENFRIDLAELLRVIEIYNTRFGTSRTGAYGINGATSDGFEPNASVDGPRTLSRYHSADTDQDAQLSLAELLRLIELYNTRLGSTRTGAYRVNDGTSDGFEPNFSTQD